MKTRVLIIGGFLGAGKTTAIWSAAKALSQSGHKVGIITNDQASELVDTRFLETAGGKTAEVALARLPRQRPHADAVERG